MLVIKKQKMIRRLKQTLEIEISLGFRVVVDDNGRFELPNWKFTTAQLKVITREINRELRKSRIELGGDYYE